MAKYIDANKLKKQLTHAGAICDFGLYLIDIQPAVDVQEVKHGKWEKINPNLCSICVRGETAWQCSVCKHKYATSGDYDVGFNYCPDCRAKMDGEVGKDENCSDNT